MAKVIFTPWKRHSELLAVRRQFYPSPDYDGADMRSQACATVGAWKLRGNLPHPVEATALLTDAILHDDALKNSVFSIRATYAAAFCRFVTGLVDSKLHGQRRTMFQRALDLGLPASFVELRHEATHRELPSLTVLRNSTLRSLEWLWDYYWVKTEHGPAALSAPLRLRSVSSGAGAEAEGVEDGDEGDSAGCASATVSALRAFLDQAVQGGEDVEPPRKKRKCGSSICLLLERSWCRLGDSMADDLAKWDSLLQMIAEGYPGFLVTLTERMIDELAFTGSSDPKSDPYCEGVYIWLDHILRSSQWGARRQVLSYSYILAACKSSSNHWTTLLGRNIDRQDDGLLAAISEKRTALPQAPSSTDEDEDLAALRTGKGNNYAYLVTDESTKQSVIIDPANPPEVVPELEAQTKAGKITLAAIVNTHHMERANQQSHWDHAGGNDELLKTFNVPIIGGKQCQSVTQTPAHGEVFKIGDRISVTALHTPCHTQDSICYFMQDGDDKAVFTGDTLFIAGCGRFFEGTAPEMHKALNETLASLPDDTKVYPGHEYTKGNVKFCLTVSQSEAIKKLEAFAEQNRETQGKFTIGDEKLHNVFMRVNDPEIQKKTGKTDPVQVMAALREMKNAM
ncbi:hypothetical protein ARAM_006902 [Aspergillus rambellii]|uniref:hydroxyacylglutathione hydrolase n=1 Tax=Aspergillus rambellii TaxID=308745 RepID=A0A0F8V1R4_9EURO|nr:hypothetical protein ARAM_006902 [Aspergillus rambellii]